MTETQEQPTMTPNNEHQFGAAISHDILVWLGAALSLVTLNNIVMTATLVYTLLRIVLVLRTLLENRK